MSLVSPRLNQAESGSLKSTALDSWNRLSVRLVKNFQTLSWFAVLLDVVTSIFARAMHQFAWATVKQRTSKVNCGLHVWTTAMSWDLAVSIQRPISVTKF